MIHNWPIYPIQFLDNLTSTHPFLTRGDNLRLNAQLRNLILTLYKSYLPLWMGPLPAGECIGWEPAVYKGQMGLIVGVTQVLEVAPQLTSVQLTLQ